MVSRSGNRNTRLLVVGLVAASLAIITLDYRQGQEGPLAGMGRGAQAFMAPLQEAVTSATRPVGDFFTGLAHLPSLSRENQDLKDQVAGLQTEVAAYAQTQEQLQQVRDLLGLRASLDPDSVAAVVIANGLSNFRSRRSSLSDHGLVQSLRSASWHPEGAGHTRARSRRPIRIEP